MNYIVSGHGGRWAAPAHKVFPKDGFTVNFFVDDGEILTNEAAWPIYNHLLAGDEEWVKSKVIKSVLAGHGAYNYSCWYYPELKWNSGIFKVGAISTKSPIIDLSKHTGDSPLSLGTIFDMLPEPGVIYWVACQVVS